jgi:hypothetical protein
MEILEPHGRRFEAALELLREGKSFTFDGVRFSLAADCLLVVAIELSDWPPDKKAEQTALSDFQRAKNVAEYLLQENSAFAAIHREHQHLFILLNYYGHGGEMEAARLVGDKVIWTNGKPPA